MISLLIILLILGLILYLIGLFPIDVALQRVLQAVAVIFALVYVLRHFGYLS